MIAAGLSAPAGAAVGLLSLSNISWDLVRLYNARDAAAFRELFTPALQAKYSIEATEMALMLCHVLTSEIHRISLPVSGTRHFGFFAVYAETKPFDMVLEIDDQEKIIQWVITDDLLTKDQQCMISQKG